MIKTFFKAKKMQREMDRKRKGVKKAQQRAINRATGTAYTESRRRTSRVMGIKQGFISKSKAIKKILARGASLTTKIVGTGRPLPLIAFAAKQLKKGVRAKPWGDSKLFKGTFIKTMPGGHKGVFQRTGGGRLPIRELFGPGVAKTLISRAVVVPVQRKFKQAWTKRIKHEIKRALKKR